MKKKSDERRILPSFYNTLSCPSVFFFIFFFLQFFFLLFYYFLFPFFLLLFFCSLILSFLILQIHLTGTTPFERSSTRALTEANLLSTHKAPSQRKLRRPKSDNLIQVLSGSALVVDESSRASGKMRESVGVMKKCSSLNASISSDQQDYTSACQSPRGYLDMDILDALSPREPGDTEDEGTICSHHSWNASKGEVHRDSNASIKSDGSDGFRADDNHHDANLSLRGDDASALLATIASLKVTTINSTHSYNVMSSYNVLCCTTLSKIL